MISDNAVTEDLNQMILQLGIHFQVMFLQGPPSYSRSSLDINLSTLSEMEKGNRKQTDSPSKQWQMEGC